MQHEFDEFVRSHDSRLPPSLHCQSPTSHSRRIQSDLSQNCTKQPRQIPQPQMPLKVFVQTPPTTQAPSSPWTLRLKGFRSFIGFRGGFEAVSRRFGGEGLRLVKALGFCSRAGKFTDEQVKSDKRFSLMGPMSSLALEVWRFLGAIRGFKFQASGGF